jgi:glutamate synthase domain-containing protein 3
MPSSENPNPQASIPEKTPSDEEIDRLVHQMDVLERLYNETLEKCGEWSGKCAEMIKVVKAESDKFIKAADGYIKQYCRDTESEDCSALKKAKSMVESGMKVLEQYATVMRIYGEYAKKCGGGGEFDAFECAAKTRLLRSETKRLHKAVSMYIKKHCAEPDEEFAENCLELKEFKAQLEELMSVLEYAEGLARTAYMLGA